ncbi:MAG: hypothetical protein ACKV2T_35860 [Kofleriaceae bacterium]
MRWGAIVLVVVAACFAPVAPTGVPCSERGTCPSGQFCELATNICRPTSDAGGEDASPCDPTETLANGECVVPITQEVAPTAISPAQCTTPDSSNSRSVGIDRSHRIYAAFQCGAADDMFVATSADGGATAMLQPLGVAGVRSIAVAGGPRKVAYVATAGSQGVVVAITADGGASWMLQTLDPMTPDGNFGIWAAVVGDSVYIAAKRMSSVRVWRNATRGVGAFDVTDVTINAFYGGMVADAQTGDVWVTGDTPDLHVRRSQDGGATFEPELDPSVSYTYSTWSLAGGYIFVTGSDQSTFSKLATSDPLMVTTVTASLPAAVSRGRTIAAGADESVLIGIEDVADAVTLIRFPPGATAGTTRMIGAGTGPSVVAGPNTTAPFVYTTANEVRLGVFVF